MSTSIKASFEEMFADLQVVAKLVGWAVVKGLEEQKNVVSEEFGKRLREKGCVRKRATFLVFYII